MSSTSPSSAPAPGDAQQATPTPTPLPQGDDSGLSYRERYLRAPRRDITPIDEPLFTFGEDPHGGATLKPWHDARDYLRSYAHSYGSQHPFSREVAEWRRDFFSSSSSSNKEDPLIYRTTPTIPPLRPDAPTIVVLFYPRPDEHVAAAGVRPIHQRASYLRRLGRIARLGEQTLVYVPPELRAEVEAMRPAGDPHWRVVDDWATPWDMPSNAHQRASFALLQPALFAWFDGYGDGDAGDLRPEPRYNHPHHSAVCNAKAFVMYDAVMRNPFGSTRWMYADAGFLFDDGPKDEGGEPWGDLFRSAAGAGDGDGESGGCLDPAKFDRAIAGASGDSGVVMGEYTHRHAGGCPTADGGEEPRWWADPRRTWRGRQFIAQVIVGSSLGFLNYAARFMRTVDEMDRAGGNGDSGNGKSFYVGREELVVALVALRYPNTVFSVPYLRLPAPWDYRWQFPMKLAFTRAGGPEAVAPVVDPLATLYCRDGDYYAPRRPALPAGGMYEGCETG
ncbi:hypothetical protein SLS62_002156 [Diatrype stigma]|uniref:Uncharacterized protein n=1 Tax=Diatrype stigma TaxID=117547 RepID=A0AAN9YVG5_9PEZI